MSDLATIRGAIVAKMQTVPLVGVVHDYERYAAQEGKFRDLYVSQIGGQQLLRGWYVSRAALKETSPMIGLTMRVSTWRITGYFGLDDSTASEKSAGELIEAICEAFRVDPTLGGAVSDTSDLTSTSDDRPSGIQVPDFGPVMLGQTLCHRAKLALTTSNTLQN